MVKEMIFIVDLRSLYQYTIIIVFIIVGGKGAKIMNLIFAGPDM